MRVNYSKVPYFTNFLMFIFYVPNDSRAAELHDELFRTRYLYPGLQLPALLGAGGEVSAFPL